MKTSPGTWEWAYEGDDCDVNALMWLGFYLGYPDTHLTDADIATLNSHHSSGDRLPLRRLALRHTVSNAGTSA